MIESEIHDKAYIGLMNDACSDEEFALIKKWLHEDDPVAIRIIGFYKMSGYRIPLNPTQGWQYLKRADKLGDLLAKTFIGIAYCRGLQTKGFRITPTQITYIQGVAMLNEAASKGWDAAQRFLDSL